MKRTEYIAKMGAMLSLICALSFVESRLCSFFPHGIRIGLANIVIMLAIFSLNAKSAFTLSFLKSVFVLCTRGPIAFFMSLSGGLLSASVVILLFRTRHSSIILCSVLGAITHNIAQLCVCSLITKSIYIFFYSPVLILSGIGAGIATGLCLCALCPKIFKSVDQEGTFTDAKKTQRNHSSPS